MPVQTYDILLNYDTSKASASLASFRADAIRQLQDISSKSAKIEVLKDLAADSKKADEALQAVKKHSEELRAVLARIGKDDVGFKQLTSEVKLADKELKAAEKSAGNVADRFKALDIELQKAGVDTKKLAQEQLALAKALDTAQRAVSAQTARGVLGVTNADEQRAQIQKLNEAYNVLRVSGTASINELAVAKANLLRKTQEVTGQQGLFNASLQQLSVAVISVAASVTAYTAALSSAISAASRYEQSVAQIASITTLNKVQLDALGKSVLELSARIGIDATEAFRSLYTIIGSGIPPENALKVLDSSARAAVAGLTSVENSAKIGVQVLNAYQLQVGQLDRVYDILFQTVRDGVISFEELSDKFGLVLPAARTAGVTLEELSASVVVLTRNGLNAPRAMVALEGAIKQLAAPTDQAAGAMAELDIQYTGFTGTIEQLSKKNIGPELLRRLIPDVEGQRAVALLTRNYGLLSSSLEEAKTAAGATKEAFDKLKDTPEQALKKFNAELNAARVASGEALLKGVLPLLTGLTSLITAFNALDGSAKGSASVIAAAAGALAVGAVAARALSPILAPLAAGLSVIGGAAGVGSLAVTGLTFALTRLGPAILAAGVPAYQFGQSFRNNDTYVRSFGDALGGTIGYLEQTQIGMLDLLSAAVTLNGKGFDAAVASLNANNKQYAEFIGTLGFAGFAIRDLEIKQIALTAALQQSQAAVGVAGAKYKDAFAGIIEAVDAPLTLLNTRIAQNAAAITSFQLRIQSDLTATKDLYQAQITQIDQLLADQTATIAVQVSKRELTEVDSIKRVTGVNIAANAGRLAALKTYGDDALRAYDLNAKAQLALAAKSGADTKQLDIEIRNGRIALINDLATKYNQYIDGAKRAEESLRDKIKGIDAEIRGIRVAQADAANKLTAQVSGEVIAYYDRQSRAEALIQKAQRATGEERKTLLAEATTLAGTLGTAVTDSYGREIDGARAAAIQQNIVNAAGKIRIADLEEEKRVLNASANSFKRIAEENKTASVDLKETLDNLFPEQQIAIKTKLETDVAATAKAMAQLQADVTTQAPLAKFKLLTDEATAAYDVFKLAVEKNRPTPEIDAKFEAFQAKYKQVTDGLPAVQLTPDTKLVDDALAGLRTSIKDFAGQKLALQSNIDEIAAKVKALDDTNLKTKQLTIEVNYTYPNGKPAVGGATDSGASSGALPGFRLGGLVTPAAPRFRAPADVPAFASGGFVGRVPGTGNKDDFLTYLENGSFVLRKDAVRAVGARGVGASGGTDYSLDGFIERVNEAPIFDRSSQLTSMFGKAQDLQNLSIAELRAKFPAGYIEGNAEVFTRDKVNRPRIEKVMAQYAAASAQRKTKSADSATNLAIEIANGMAIPARGLTTEELSGLDHNEKAVAEAIARLDKEAKEAAEQKDGKRSPPKKAAGGAIDGGTMALVMPGEHVFSPAEVKRIGLGNLMAMNSAKLPKLPRFELGGLVSRMAAMPAQPSLSEAFAHNVGGRLAAFNEGGSVSNSTTNNVTFSPNVTINAASDVDVRQSVRQLLPEFKAALRREGIRL